MDKNTLIKIFSNKENCKKILDCGHWIPFEYFPQEIREDYEFAKQAVTLNGKLLKNVGKILRDDEEIVSLACSQGLNNILFWASDRLRDDPRMALLAYEHSKSVFGASDRIQEMVKGKDVKQVLINLIELSRKKSGRK